MASSDPFADLPSAQPSRGSNDPFADLPSVGGIDRNAGWGKSAADFAYQAAGPGFNKGVNSFLSIPGDVMAWGAEKAGVPKETADKLRFKGNPVSEFLTSGPEPETNAGRYGEQAGHVIGGQAIPMLATYGMAPTMAATAPSANTAREIVRQTGEMITKNPVQAAAMDIAGAASSGMAQKGAEDLGFGPTGQAIAAILGGFAPVVGTASLPSRQMASQRATEAAADIAAHEATGVRPFGPSFNQGATASVAKQLSETPLIGAPVKNALDSSLEGARDAVLRQAQRMGPEAAEHEIGTSVQSALDRYRNAGVNAVDEPSLQALGIQPSAAVPTNRMMSTPASARAQQADQIRQQQGVAPQPINQVAIQRRTAADLSDRDLQQIIHAPSDQTSFAAKAEALYEQAWRSIPTLLRSNGTTGADRLSAVNTRAAMGDVQNQVANQIAGQGRINGDLADRLMNGNSHFTLTDLRAIRTEVGRALGNFGVGDARLDRTQLRQLYGALSRDIEVGTMDLANRARIASQLPPSDPRYLPPQVVQQAERALPLMRRADQFFRAGQDRIDNFMRVIGANTPEAAAKSLATAALGRSRGDFNMLRTARAALRPDEWNQFSGNVLRQLGEPLGSARGTTQEIGFSVSSFMTRWNNMTPEARNLLFGGEHQRAIENLVRVINRLANVEALANTSRSATNALNVSGAIGVGSRVIEGHPYQALGMLTSGFALSTLMAQPAWANWAARYAMLRSRVVNSPAVSDREIAKHVAALGTMARANPILEPIYKQALKENNLRDGHAR